MVTTGMEEFYKKICDDNLYDYGHRVEHLEHFGRLYSDETHFLYEILQNAEDACATDILFELSPDNLKIWHNGNKFTEKDVKAITKISDSTKDINDVGKFGLGFKSVYAVTDCPEIHSDVYDFCIKKYIRPEAIEPILLPSHWTTLFVLPLKSGKQKELYEKIYNKLRSLELRVVLFLRNLNSIHWTVTGEVENEGQYLKEVKHTEEDGVKRIYCLDNENNYEEWILFSKMVDPAKNLFVDLAFLYDENQKSIVPANKTDLVVLFPTEKTTGLKFIINGKFKTTPSRENIPTQDQDNIMLVKEVGSMMRDVLEYAKKHGLLNVSLLQTLPIEPERFTVNDKTEFFKPIYDSVKQLLSANAYIPTVEYGIFAAAKDMVIARSRELIKLYRLQDKQWLTTEITSDKTYGLFKYLNNELGIKEITPTQFCAGLDKGFLEKRSDQWFIDFYKFAVDQRALWKKNDANQWSPSNEGILRSKPIIRLEDDTLITPKELAYLPGSIVVDGAPIIKKTLTEDPGAKEFLELLEFKEPTKADLIEQIILKKKYTTEHANVSDDEYRKDVGNIIKVMQDDSVSENDKRELAKYRIIKGEAGLFYRVNDVYVASDELKNWFDGVKRNYAASVLSTNELVALGVSTLPHVEAHILHKLDIPEQKREPKSDKSNPECCVDVTVDGLKEKIVTPESAVDFAEMIRKLYEDTDSELFDTCSKNQLSYGLFESDYIYYKKGNLQKTKYATSVVDTLKNKAWVLTKNGKVESPTLLSTNDVDERIIFLRDFAGSLFGDELNKSIADKQRAAETLGISKKIAEVISSPDFNERWAAFEKWEACQLREDVALKEPDWEPETSVEDTDIEETEFVRTSSDRGVVGTSNSTRQYEQIFEVEGETSNMQKMSTANRQRIGELGERLARKWLLQQGFKDTEIRVVNTDVDNGTGRDIEILRDGEIIQYIEIKSTIDTKGKHLFVTSGKQWESARNNPDKFWYYCIFGVGTSKVKLIRINNPIQMWKNGLLEAHPVNFIVRVRDSNFDDLKDILNDK